MAHNVLGGFLALGHLEAGLHKSQLRHHLLEQVKLFRCWEFPFTSNESDAIPSKEAMTFVSRHL